MRSKLQEAEQARRSGTRLGATGTEADWMAAVRLGRKRRAVGAETLSNITVSPATILACAPQPHSAPASPPVLPSPHQAAHCRMMQIARSAS